jgi:transposase-like protein
MKLVRRGIMARRQKYSKEYKEAAVALSKREDKTVEQVARELGIRGDMLRHWRQEAGEAEQRGLPAFPGQGNPRDEELARLRKRVADLEEANEILKKAAVVFGRSPR